MKGVKGMNDQAQTKNRNKSRNKSRKATVTTNLKENAMAHDTEAKDLVVVSVPEPVIGETAPVKGPEILVAALESDYGNALRLKFFFGLVTFFHHIEKTWYFWSGKNWQRDTYQSLTEKMIQTVERILTIEIPWLNHLEKLPEQERGTRNAISPAMKFIRESFNRSKIVAALKIAADLIPVPAALDTHKSLLNCQNGTVNLKAGELQEHNKGDFITKIVPVNYDRDAKCPRFMAFLERAFPNNPEGIRFIQKIFGYSLTGDVSEKKLFILWGAAGNNGKTLLFNVFRGILGSCFCVQMASESLVSGRVNAIRSDIAKLIGHRFVTASETDKKYKFNEALIKLLTGGDAIVARHPHEREIEFTPELKLFIGTNAKPEFTLSDRAMMNRVCIIPFHVSIPLEEQDKKLTQTLIDEEAEGILAWAVEGARLWSEDGGLGENPFDQDTAAVIHPVVTIEQFLEKCCVRGPEHSVKSRDLQAAFNQFKVEQGDLTPELNVKSFGNLLNDCNLESKRQSDGIYRLHIALNDDGKKLLAAANASDEPSEGSEPFNKDAA
jgi:putative DNA primase/helicase